MIEIPESKVFASRAENILRGKVIVDVINATNPHRFAWYHGDPLLYSSILVGRKVENVKGFGCYIDICFDQETHLAISDGTNMKYFQKADKCPQKFQLLVVFDDSTYVVFTVAMYGGIFAFKGTFDYPYYCGSRDKLSPLDKRFDFDFFHKMITDIGKNISVKALLATEQRIPGLGNGVLQDILFNAGINPKRKINTLSDKDEQTLFVAIKETLENMISQGGRDTEKDLLGNSGGYHCILSKNTCHELCPRCGGKIIKEAYLGGSIYYCRDCQTI